MAETQSTPEALERIRSLLVADVAENLRQVRGKSESRYNKIQDAQMAKVYRLAEQLAHPDPYSFANSVMDEATEASGLHPQLVADIVDRVVLDEKLKAQDRDNIAYAKAAFERGETEPKIIADLVERSFPDDPAKGYTYARYILAETRRAEELERRAAAVPEPEQTYMSTQTSNRNPNSDQYKRDWAYAARALAKGDSPEKVIQAMAEYRKDLPDPQKYAEATVAKIQDYLEIQAELKPDSATPPEKAPETADLKRTLQQVSDLEYARHLYEDGKDKNAVIEALITDRMSDPTFSIVVAREAELRHFAERDLNYAVRAQQRGEANDRVIPKIAEYRQGKIDDPQQYARAIVDAAGRTHDAERGALPSAAIDQRIQSAHDQYRRDVQFAVFQLESRPRDQVRLEIAERRPERAYESPLFRLHGQPDPTYAVAVVQQAEKVRELTEKGRSLEQVLDTAEQQFGRHVQEALNARESGKSRSEVMDRISQGAPAQEFYARAVVNQADSMREQQREMSVRPELARAAIEHFRGNPEHQIVRAASTMDR